MLLKVIFVPAFQPGLTFTVSTSSSSRRRRSSTITLREIFILRVDPEYNSFRVHLRFTMIGSCFRTRCWCIGWPPMPPMPPMRVPPPPIPPKNISANGSPPMPPPMPPPPKNSAKMSSGRLVLKPPPGAPLPPPPPSAIPAFRPSSPYWS